MFEVRAHYPSVVQATFLLACHEIGQFWTILIKKIRNIFNLLRNHCLFQNMILLCFEMEHICVWCKLYYCSNVVNCITFQSYRKKYFFFYVFNETCWINLEVVEKRRNLPKESLHQLLLPQLQVSCKGVRRENKQKKKKKISNYRVTRKTRLWKAKKQAYYSFYTKRFEKREGSNLAI